VSSLSKLEQASAMYGSNAKWEEEQLVSSTTPDGPPSLGVNFGDPMANAIFEQTARELWSRLHAESEEGRSSDQTAEVFQNHMVAVYAQMATQQQYEAIAEQNKVVAVQGPQTPSNVMEQLNPLFGRASGEHRTAVGAHNDLKFFEKSQKSGYNVFVGGLRTVTSEERLAHYFAKFGEVTFVEVKRLPDKTSRGFGFVQFREYDAVERVLRWKEPHLIDGKWIDCKAYEAKEQRNMPKKNKKRWYEEEELNSASSSGTLPGLLPPTTPLWGSMNKALRSTPY